MWHPLAKSFTCPICGHVGAFKSISPETGHRRHARCPRCQGLERHRLQWLVFDRVCRTLPTHQLRMLHFAPEGFFRDRFRERFAEYATADLSGVGVDYQEDVTKLSFPNGRFDVIYASHVLEHVREDRLALQELVRVLTPTGVAFIDVPIIGSQTIEYPEPNRHEHYHVRCPGEDYYQRLYAYFPWVELYRSADFDSKYQPYVYEKRTAWPSTMPLRPTMPGLKHESMMAVAYKAIPTP